MRPIIGGDDTHDLDAQSHSLCTRACHTEKVLRIFGGSVLASVAVLVTMLVLGGPRSALLVAILAVLEISLSFDNAVINASVLRRMSAVWQRIFLTVGVIIATFGMRLIFPILVVSVTAHLSPAAVTDLALHDSTRYGRELAGAHSAIAAFGGTFLLMIFLDFLVADREVRWVRWIESPLARAGRLPAFSVVLTLGSLFGLTASVSTPNERTVLVSGVAGLVTYLLVHGVSELVAPAEQADPWGRRQAVLATGKAALALFCYLEVLDASFSFDGVIGAFAISSDVFVIAAGLGIGALFIRSMTVWLVRRGTLEEYVFLEHGAHYALGALAVILGLSIEHEIPEVVTGLIGAGFIALAYGTSLRRRRRLRSCDDQSTHDSGPDSAHSAPLPG
jgi:hypothetical protein